MLGAVLKLLRALMRRGRSWVPQDWPRWAALLPHVLAAASHFRQPAPPGAGRGAGRCFLAAGSRRRLPENPCPAGRGPAGSTERALIIIETAYGPDHPDVAIPLNNLAHILRDLGQPAEARPLAERALTITEAAYGPGHPQAATLRG